MAGHNNSDGIGTIGQPDGARRAGLAQLRGERAITAGFAGRNAAQRRPHPALEITAAGSDRQRIERRHVAAEIRGERAGNGRGQRGFDQPVLAIMPGEQAVHAFLEIAEIERAQHAIAVTDDEQVERRRGKA